MPSRTFEDPALMTAMRQYLDAVDALERATAPRDVMDLADAKALAGLALRKRLLALGWTAPMTQRSKT